MQYVAASNVILVITAAVLFYAALTDLKHYTIRNEVVLVLTLLFFVHAFVSGRWASIPWNIAFSSVILIVLIYLYSHNLVGGGDVKLLTVALLWAGLGCALPFAIFLLISTTIHTLAAKMGWVDTQRVPGDDRKRIPFAPSVAVALIGIFLLGCLQPI
jgi:Flp pilus assembly protein protease CpaA